MSYVHAVYRNGGRDVTAAEGTFTQAQGSKGCIRGKREETRGIGYNTPRRKCGLCRQIRRLRA